MDNRIFQQTDFCLFPSSALPPPPGEFRNQVCPPRELERATDESEKRRDSAKTGHLRGLRRVVVVVAPSQKGHFPQSRRIAASADGAFNTCLRARVRARDWKEKERDLPSSTNVRGGRRKGAIFQGNFSRRRQS